MTLNDWRLSYTDYEPADEGLRETLCALGNGYIVSRACAADADADDVHYPGTFMAGGYNRLDSEIAGVTIENEDLVNMPNWLPLAVRAGDGPWLKPETVQYLSHHQELDLKEGVLTRSLRFRDEEGRVTRWEERRLVSMHDPHLAALTVTLTPENWSGTLTVRSAIDGGVINWGVKRYRALAGRHLETLECSVGETGIMALRSRLVQGRREIALAARTSVTVEGEHASLARSEANEDFAAEEYDLSVGEGTPVTVEKIAAYYNSMDHAISEPLLAAVEHVRRASDFRGLHQHHALAWDHLWEQFDIKVESVADGDAQLKLRLHIFHLLQTASVHSIEMDVGVPARGWHGEAYRGHIFWDELFIFPYLTLRKPLLTRSFLRYRFRRLDAARRAAREAGYRGAMFPWQSGSDGREETQRIHLNPKSGRWIPDKSRRQRHIGAAIAYNIWAYLQATDDHDFLRVFGAELFCEIARFWASIAELRPDGRYGICGVMGPDEFHTNYPDADPEAEGGLDNNAYTNLMVSWLLTRAFDVLSLLADDERRRLCERIALTDDELATWEKVSRKLYIPFHDGGIISQFEGYDSLEELDWDAYRARYGSLQRLDRILEAEGEDPNKYKITKQADVLMIFYLFSREEIERIFDQLGYQFTPEMIHKNIKYYSERTSHGSTLSLIVHAWVWSRADRQSSWQLALDALDSDLTDIQGGTTPEGIHLGAMAGTVDLVQRCYTGLEMRSGALSFNPRLPNEVQRLQATVRYRRQILDVEITHESLVVNSRIISAHPITLVYRGQSREISPGQSCTFGLIPELKDEQAAKALAEEQAREQSAVALTVG